MLGLQRTESRHIVNFRRNMHHGSDPLAQQHKGNNTPLDSKLLSVVFVCLQGRPMMSGIEADADSSGLVYGHLALTILPLSKLIAT